MKINKIAKICKKNKSLILSTEENGSQWIGNGAAYYRVEGMPEIDTGNVFAMFELDEDKVCEKWYISEEQMPGMFDLSMAETGDRVQEALMIFEWDDVRTIALQTDAEEVLMVNDLYFVPVAEEMTEMIVRHTQSGAPYIIVRRGFFNIAIVMPMRIRASAEELERKLQRLTQAVSEQAEKAVREEGRQIGMEEIHE